MPLFLECTASAFVKYREQKSATGFQSLLKNTSIILRRSLQELKGWCVRSRWRWKVRDKLGWCLSLEEVLMLKAQKTWQLVLICIGQLEGISEEESSSEARWGKCRRITGHWWLWRWRTVSGKDNRWQHLQIDWLSDAKEGHLTEGLDKCRHSSSIAEI